MHTTQSPSENQGENTAVQDAIADFFAHFHIGSLLNRSGIRKVHGARPLDIITVLFSLPFQRTTQYWGIVRNQYLGFRKDAVYMERPRSKAVELLANVYDHCTKKYIITKLSAHRPVICMLKRMKNVYYTWRGEKINLASLYRRVKKRRGKARILASVLVTIAPDKMVKIVFVRDRRKKDWLALLSTDIDLADTEVVRIYGKRWDIEVFFKMSKQYLQLETGVQIRNFDGLIAHTTITLMRYLFLIGTGATVMIGHWENCSKHGATNFGILPCWRRSIVCLPLWPMPCGEPNSPPNSLFIIS